MNYENPTRDYESNPVHRMQIICNDARYSCPKGGCDCCTANYKANDPARVVAFLEWERLHCGFWVIDEGAPFAAEDFDIIKGRTHVEGAFRSDIDEAMERR